MSDHVSDQVKEGLLAEVYPGSRSYAADRMELAVGSDQAAVAVCEALVAQGGFLPRFVELALRAWEAVVVPGPDYGLAQEVCHRLRDHLEGGGTMVTPGWVEFHYEVWVEFLLPGVVRPPEALNARDRSSAG